MLYYIIQTANKHHFREDCDKQLHQLFPFPPIGNSRARILTCYLSAPAEMRHWFPFCYVGLLGASKIERIG